MVHLCSCSGSFILMVLKSDEATCFESDPLCKSFFVETLIPFFTGFDA